MSFIFSILICAFFLFVLIRRLTTTAGKAGENAVARNLHWLPKDRYFVINDLLLDRGNGYTTQIDHVVVSPYGVFVIETKNIYGYIHGSDNSKLWRSCWRNRDLSFDNPILQNEAHIKALASILKDKQVKYISIIAFSNNAILQVSVEHTNVICWNKLRKLIRMYTEQVMTAKQAREIYGFLLSLNIMDNEARKRHSVRAQINKANYEQKQIEAVESGKCPRCGGNLVKRRGTYGSFYGCANYPDCKFTAPSAE